MNFSCCFGLLSHILVGFPATAVVYRVRACAGAPSTRHCGSILTCMLPCTKLAADILHNAVQMYLWVVRQSTAADGVHSRVSHLHDSRSRLRGTASPRTLVRPHGLGNIDHQCKRRSPSSATYYCVCRLRWVPSSATTLPLKVPCPAGVRAEVFVTRADECFAFEHSLRVAAVGLPQTICSGARAAYGRASDTRHFRGITLYQRQDQRR